MAANKPILRISKSSEYLELKARGKRMMADSWLLLSYKKEDCSRYGWTIPKYVGNAVVRNRFKRWARELLRKQNINPLAAINLVFRKMDRDFYKTLDHETFDATVLKALTRLKRKISH